jgi:hypothetical protein
MTGTQTNRVRVVCGVSLALTLTLTLIVARSVNAQAATRPNLESLIVQSGDIPGLAPQMPSAHNAQQLTDLIQSVNSNKAAAAAEVAHLRNDGLIAELDAALGPGSPSVIGTTQVWYFKSPGGAKSYSSYEFSSIESGSSVFDFSGNYRKFNTGVAGARSLAAKLPSDPSTKTPSMETTLTYVTTGHCVVLISLIGNASTSPKPISLQASAAKKVEARDKRGCE